MNTLLSPATVAFLIYISNTLPAIQSQTTLQTFELF